MSLFPSIKNSLWILLNRDLSRRIHNHFHLILVRYPIECIISECILVNGLTLPVVHNCFEFCVKSLTNVKT